MKIIKGFATHANFANNKKNIVNTLGELSTHSLTYEMDKGIYHSSIDNRITLYTFKTLEDNDYVELDADWLNHVYTIINYIYGKTLAAKELWSDELLNALITDYSDIAESFKCGAIVKDNGYYCPEWISWKRKNVESSIKIWFSDDSFRRRYDDYSIIVVPALEPVDVFFKTKKEVQSLLEAQTPTKYTERVEKTRNNKPCTVSRVFEATWHNKLDQTETLNTIWTVLIYGIAGNNIDSIKDAISNHIISNSTHNRDEWKEIFPDIFKRTEFIFVPRWDMYAIPNRTTVQGIYSPVVQIDGLVEYAKPFMSDYSDQCITKYLSVFPHTYRSITSIVCGNEENRDNLYKITDVYPDYIAENSLSQDFNRMSEKTRNWAEKISEMIIISENMTDYSDIPDNMNKMFRNGKLYLTQSIENVQYLVAAKCNFFKNVVNGNANK